jgi:prepilin-type N-terminal cleavage/methylation domain-containing protein
MKDLCPVRPPWPGQGYSLIELLFVLGVVAILTGVALPRLSGGLDEWRTRSAIRYLTARLQQTRMEAVTRSVNTALRFTAADASFSYATYVDGNRNGVRTVDIEQGLDRRVDSQERLRDKFPGVDFGTLPGLPAVEGSESAPGADPVRLGSSNMVTFTAGGMSSPGSLYVLGPRNTQFVVRILGETGKIRILRFDRRGGTWRPL